MKQIIDRKLIMSENEKEYHVSWSWDRHVLGGYGPVASTPEKAKEAWGKDLLPEDCIVSRPIGGEEQDWEFHSF